MRICVCVHACVNVNARARSRVCMRVCALPCVHLRISLLVSPITLLSPSPPPSPTPRPSVIQPSSSAYLNDIKHSDPLPSCFRFQKSGSFVGFTNRKPSAGSASLMSFEIRSHQKRNKDQFTRILLLLSHFHREVQLQTVRRQQLSQPPHISHLTS